MRRTAATRHLRSTFISVIALLLLCGGFTIYWRMQTIAPPVDLGKSSTMPITPPLGQTELQIGPGQRAWVDNYDGGQLSSQFHADEFTPQSDGKFQVVKPVWVFYLSDGQYILLTGDTGIVHVDSAGQTDSLMNSAIMQSPDSGVLQNVKILLYPTSQSQTPSLKLETHNVAFDNDTLRLYTQSYQDDTGATVRADQVPVTVRGDDYEFDGQGLTMHWNDRDHHLQLLEIEHGHRLEIKNPSHLSISPAPPPTAHSDLDHPLSEQWASADPTAAIPPPAGAAVGPQLYQAVFNDDVQIFQGDHKSATADTMTVDFLTGGQKPPATAPSTPRTPAAPIENEPTAPLAAQKLVAGPTTAAVAAAPASRPTTQPITVYWTGKLRITPLEGPPILPLVAGESVVRMVGSPVVLTPVGSVTHAAAVVYRTVDGAGRLENSDAFPTVDMKQDKGGSFIASSAVYDPSTSLATILGPSTLHTPVQGHPNEMMTTTWSQKGLIHLIRNGQQPDSVDHVDLFGDVAVNHPQMRLNSDTLSLDLQKAPARAKGKESSDMDLKRVTADGSVVCRLMQNGSFDRGIDADHLVLETIPGSDGKAVPRTVNADGNVRAFDPEQKLQAGHLEAVLASTPSTQPSENGNFTVESMIARDTVRADIKAGSSAQAQQLHMNMIDGRRQIDLYGGETPAILKDGKQGTLSGPLIHLWPDESKVIVDGGGRAHSVRAASATQPASPLDIAWTHDLAADVNANTIDVHGHVTATTVDKQGNHDQVVADSAHVDLMNAPPSTQPLRANVPKDDKKNPAKQVKKLVLSGNLDATSVLTAANGTLLRRAEMIGPMLTYDAVAGHAVVPGPGKALLEDHRPPAVGADAGGNNRGSMAIEWSKSLVYDKPANQAIFSGDVVIGFKRQASDAEPMHLNCDAVTVDLAPPAKGAATDASAVQISRLTALGAARFQGKGADFSAHSIVYDPKTFLLTARGTPDAPGETFDAQGTSTGTFDELIYNTQTQITEEVRGARGGVHR